MKKTALIIISISLAFTVTGQTFLLLDRRLYQPALLADKITKESLDKGWFPVYVSDMDTLISMVEEFKHLNRDGLNRKYFNADNFKSEHIEFTISSYKRAYGDSYDITLIYTTPQSKTTLRFSDPAKLNPDNQAFVRLFLDYIKQAKKDMNKPEKKKKMITNNPFIE